MKGEGIKVQGIGCRAEGRGCRVKGRRCGVSGAGHRPSGLQLISLPADSHQSGQFNRKINFEKANTRLPCIVRWVGVIIDI